MSGESMDKETDPRVVYADVYDLPRWEPKSHPRMDMYLRAAQFAPFAALTGFDDMVTEEARLTGTETDPGEAEREILDRKLAVVADAAANGERPVVTITFFVPDPYKSGGEYLTVTETVHRVDPAKREVVLERTAGKGKSRLKIAADRIIALRGELVDGMESML